MVHVFIVFCFGSVTADWSTTLTILKILNERPNMIRNLGNNHSKTKQHKCMHTSGNLPQHIILVTLKYYSLETVPPESSLTWPVFTDDTFECVFLNLVDCHLLWFIWILTVTGNITNVPHWFVLERHLTEFDVWLVPKTLTISNDQRVPTNRMSRQYLNQTTEPITAQT